MSNFGILLAIIVVIIAVLSLGFVWSLLWLFLIGLVYGILGRMALAGRRDVSLLATSALGIGGSLLGGVIGKLTGHTSWLVEGIVGVLCTAILLLIFTDRAPRDADAA